MKRFINSELLGNYKKRLQKDLEKKDEQILLLKIVNEYYNNFQNGNENKGIDRLYQLLTGETRKNNKIGVEVQPLTHRDGEGNTNLDLAMGSIKQRENTISGIELDKNGENQNFVFCEAKWGSDLSVGVTNCSIRNQLQRVIENALIFAGENFQGKIFITLITPKKYKEHFEMGIDTRFYSCKYRSYKENLKKNFLKELDLIESCGEIPFREIEGNRKNREIIEENLEKVVLNWTTFEELIEGLGMDISVFAKNI